MSKVYACWAVDEIPRVDGKRNSYAGRIDKSTCFSGREKACWHAFCMVRDGLSRGVLVIELDEGGVINPTWYIGEVSARCCREGCEWDMWIKEQIEHAAASTIYEHARGLVEMPG